MLHTVAQSRPFLSQRETSNLFFYFFHLNEKDPLEFAQKWDQIPNAVFTAKSYAQILYKTATNLNAPNINFDIRGKILSHIRTNIDAWLSPALENIEYFNEQALSNSLWALAALDSYYSEDSLTKTYHALRPYIYLNNNSYCDALQQVRDVDLWFTGYSNVPNPKNNNPTPPLIFENNIRDAFDKSGFTINNPKTPLIHQLKKAIDFPVTNKNGTQELWAEVDGCYHVLNLNTAETPSDILYNTHTQFRSALERRLAPPESIILRVDPLSGSEIVRLSKEDTRSSRKKLNVLCKKTFNNAQKVGPGIHRTFNLEAINPTEALHPMITHDRNLKLALAT